MHSGASASACSRRSSTLLIVAEAEAVNEAASSEARAERLAALVVAAVESANRAQPRRAPPGLLLEVAAELEGVIAGALP
jgi:hypothetical protein